MKRCYTRALIMAISIIVGFNLNAQERVVVVEPHDTLNLNEFILADTNAAGEWNDPVNTVYELKRNSIYMVSKQIDVRDTKLHIRGQEGDGTGQKAVIMQRVKETGGYNKVLFTRGDAIIENVRITAQEAGKTYSWNAIRILGANSKVVFRNCIIEKQGGSIAALYAEGVDITLDRCEGRFLGQPTKVTGNGRIIDGRKSSARVKVVDCFFYNVMAVAFSGWGNHHKYVEFDHNTFVNMAGQNRLFQFNHIVDSVKVTNNIFMNCFFAGDYPNKMLEDKAADAKHGSNPGTLAYFFCPDSLPQDKNQWTISNNNVFYTADFADSMATYPDTIVLPPVMSPNYAAWRGDLANDVYFEEVLDFPSVPATPTWVWKNYYTDVNGELPFPGYFVPVHPQDATADSVWYKFDVNSIDMSYSANSASATAGTDGGQIGSRLFTLTTSVKDVKNAVGVSAYPNPANDYITFKFTNGNIRNGNVTIYSLTGAILKSESISQFDSEVTIDLTEFEKGIYLYSIQNAEGSNSGKFVVE